MTPARALVSFLLIASASFPAVAQTTKPDARGCEDHPLFTRMQNMRIVQCKTADFDRFTFRMTSASPTPVEGKRFQINYTIQPGSKAPSALAIIRNYQQAVGRIGGTVLYEDRHITTLKVKKDDREIWSQVDTNVIDGYVVTIVEKQAMVQEVVANAEIFRTGLKTSGHVEVPGIYFDTGKAELKPQSEAALAEIAKLLKAEPNLKVYVVGHTDNVASLDVNTKLSQARADAVVKALVASHGIAATRLTGRGAGPLAPVASNDSEAGRAQNRRVELVKQ